MERARVYVDSEGQLYAEGITMTPTPDKPAGEALKACPHTYCTAFGNEVRCLACQVLLKTHTRTPPPSALDDEVVAVLQDGCEPKATAEWVLWRDRARDLLTRLKDIGK